MKIHQKNKFPKSDSVLFLSTLGIRTGPETSPRASHESSRPRETPPIAAGWHGSRDIYFEKSIFWRFFMIFLDFALERSAASSSTWWPRRCPRWSLNVFNDSESIHTLLKLFQNIEKWVHNEKIHLSCAAEVLTAPNILGGSRNQQNH